MAQRIITKKPELLAPAGNLEKLKVAVVFGADAVFIGGQKFSLRANADNFSIAEIEEGVLFAKSYNARIYVTMNILGHVFDFDELDEYLYALESAGVHGIIAADPTVILRAKEITPRLEVHLSTQQSVTNSYTAKMWQQLGLERIVLARELTKDEIAEIMNAVDCEFEVFVHGAMCIAYSGRCTLSNHMTTRDSNRGGCCQSCRWEFELQNNHQSFIEEDSDLFAMSPKDLNLLQSIPEMIEMGVDSLKIEGRMKSIHYVATVVSVYRKLIDTYCENPDAFVFNDALLLELQKCANRATAPAFFAGIPGSEEQMYNNRDEHPTKEFIGIVKGYNEEKKLLELEQRNFFKMGTAVEFFAPFCDNIYMDVIHIEDEDGNIMDAARHPLQRIFIPSEINIPIGALMRKVDK
ncbi:MAG: peptidase U32 family protein [Culicoidibacterales bacterium]